MKNIKHNHHVVPKSYLNGFCEEDEMVFVYQKHDLDKKPYKKKTEKIAIELDFYAIHHDDGAMSDTFEDTLAEIIEIPALPSLIKIRAEETLSFDDLQQLSMYFGFMLIRTPHFRDVLETQLMKELKNHAVDAVKFQTWAKENLKTNDLDSAQIEDLRNEIYKRKSLVGINQNYFLTVIQFMGFLMAHILMEMKWIILKSPDNLNFITSDDPCLLTSRDFSDFLQWKLHNDLKIFIPLSSKLGVIFISTNELKERVHSLDIDERTLKLLNGAIVCISQYEIYASFELKNLEALFQQLTDIKYSRK